jgi:hypothetical protein
MFKTCAGSNSRTSVASLTRRLEDGITIRESLGQAAPVSLLRLCSEFMQLRCRPSFAYSPVIPDLVF